VGFAAALMSEAFLWRVWKRAVISKEPARDFGRAKRLVPMDFLHEPKP
jgi:hypothetical protein